MREDPTPVLLHAPNNTFTNHPPDMLHDMGGRY